MIRIWQQLEQAFTDDHKVMTRGLRDLIRALDQRDFRTAKSLSTRLDQASGPHIEFEERFLYPAVRESRGEDYVSRLFDEHHQVLSVIVALQSLTDDAVPTDDEIEGWKRSLELGLDHAPVCGTLLSHLQALPPEQQRDHADTIARLRDKGRGWSEIRDKAS